MSMLTEIVEVVDEDDQYAVKAKESRPATELHKNWISSDIVDVAVAVGKGSSSLQALQWALNNQVVPPGGVLHLLHIQAPLRFIPSPMGNNIPLEGVSEDMANRHKMQRFLATEQLLYKYKRICDDKQVNCEICYSEGDVIHKKLVNQITDLCVAKLIIGASPQSRLTKALRKQTVASLVVKNAPDFCTVLVVCKGKLQSIKEAAKTAHCPEMS